MHKVKKISLYIFIIVSFLVTGAVQADPKWNKTFVHGIAIEIHGHLYNLTGPPDGPNGAQDIPGHEWVRVSKNTLIGKSYNTGPFGSPGGWSSDAEDGELLWTMIGKIDTWSEAKAARYFTQGYVHYQTLVSVETGTLHNKLVVWLKHAAVRDFTFDGLPQFVAPYDVKVGVDYKIVPNWNVPYNPEIAN